MVIQSAFHIKIIQISKSHHCAEIGDWWYCKGIYYSKDKVRLIYPSNISQYIKRT